MQRGTFAFGLNKEPLVVTALTTAIMLVIVEFDVITRITGLTTLTEGQETAVQSLIAAAMLAFARSQVTSSSTLHQAGTNKQEMADVAADPHRVMIPTRVVPPNVGQPV